VTRGAQPRLYSRSNVWSFAAWLRSDRPCVVAEFSSDGRWVVTGATDGTARVWNAERGEVAFWVRHGGAVSNACFSPDGRWLLTGARDDTAVVWDATNGTRRLTLEHPAPLRVAEFSRDARRILTLAQDGHVRIWKGPFGRSANRRDPPGNESARLLASWQPHEGGVSHARFSPDGGKVVTVSADSNARLWDARTGRPLSDPLAHGGEIFSIEFSPDGRRVLTASQDKTAVVWDVADGRKEAVLQHAAAVFAARFSADGRQIVTGSEDGKARLWDTATGYPVASPLEHGDPVEDVAFSPDGAWLAVAGGRAVKIWVVPRCATSTPDWLAPLAEAVAGLRQVTTLSSQTVPPAAFLDLRQQLSAKTQRSAVEAWGAWFVADRSQRNPTPSPTPTLAELLAREEATARSGMPSSASVTTWLLPLHPTNDHFAPAPRDPAAPSSLIDLTDFYTGGFDTDWRASGFPRHNLSTLPRGRQVLEGVEHDLRGLVQLASTLLEARELHFQRAVEDIPIGRRCARLHFLHAADCAAEAGLPLATYTIRRGDGNEEAIPISYGTELLSWDALTVPEAMKGGVVWRGTSPVGDPVWLFRTSWTNTHPELTVESVTLMSALAGCAPFVVAITAE
jgi:hypothetical protein